MELKQLTHFVAVAETHSFTVAAQRLRISQPGLSSSIQALERDVGAVLLERTTRRVLLTPAGAALLDSARLILGEIATARRRIAGAAGLTTGQLAVGMVQTFSSVDVPAALAGLHRRHPGIQLTLREAPTADLLRAVLRGELDLAFAALDGTRLPDGLTVRRSYTERIVVVVGEQHRLAGRSRVRLADLAEETFIEFRAGQGLQTVIENVCADAGLHRRIGCAVSDMDQVLSLVGHGLGVALVPAPLADRSGLPAISVAPRAPSRTLALVTRTTPSGNPAARALLEILSGE
ncbi:LysR family transcriptional regulator [Flexivirga sp.]|uniref:LysR family transcriptional regulator n=1 Tax=Flexivirga sp. TaxID=1962927 RepID=UPI003F7D0A4D